MDDLGVPPFSETLKRVIFNSYVKLPEAKVCLGAPLAALNITQHTTGGYFIIGDHPGAIVGPSGDIS